jgi:hypothetical protein
VLLGRRTNAPRADQPRRLRGPGRDRASEVRGVRLGGGGRVTASSARASRRRVGDRDRDGAARHRCFASLERRLRRHRASRHRVGDRGRDGASRHRCFAATGTSASPTSASRVAFEMLSAVASRGSRG